MANLRLFAANGNGKQTFVFLVGKSLTLIDDCCFSKHTVNLAKLNFKHLIEKQFSMIQI
jgi:hypothetical protein